MLWHNDKTEDIIAQHHVYKLLLLPPPFFHFSLHIGLRNREMIMKNLAGGSKLVHLPLDLSSGKSGQGSWEEWLAEAQRRP